jgi:hypothetical protein
VFSTLTFALTLSGSIFLFVVIFPASEKGLKVALLRGFSRRSPFHKNTKKPLST